MEQLVTPAPRAVFLGHPLLVVRPGCCIAGRIAPNEQRQTGNGYLNTALARSSAPILANASFSAGIASRSTPSVCIA